MISLLLLQNALKGITIKRHTGGHNSQTAFLNMYTHTHTYNTHTHREILLQNQFYVDSTNSAELGLNFLSFWLWGRGWALKKRTFEGRTARFHLPSALNSRSVTSLHLKKKNEKNCASPWSIINS